MFVQNHIIWNSYVQYGDFAPMSGIFDAILNTYFTWAALQAPLDYH